MLSKYDAGGNGSNGRVLLENLILTFEVKTKIDFQKYPLNKPIL